MVKMPVNIPLVSCNAVAQGKWCYLAIYAQGMMLEAPSEAGLKISELLCMSAIPDLGEDLAEAQQPWTYFLSFWYCFVLFP